MKNIKLFTDFDLDGIGCGILAKLLWEDSVDITYCNSHNPNPYLDEFFTTKEYANYELIYMTDVSPNEENAKKIQQLISDKFTLLDHHETALWLNKYDWAQVDISLENGKTSGTSLLCEHILERDHFNDSYDYLKIHDFVELVRRYDTWEWSTKYNDNNAKRLNDLCMFLGRDRFIEIAYNNLTNSKSVLDDSMNLILDVQEEKCKQYIKFKNPQLKVFKYDIDNIRYQFGVIFSERYEFVSVMGNELAKLHPELDFVMIVNTSGTVNLRGIKDDINLSLIANHFNGGGHAKASGFKFDINILDDLVYNILDM